MAGDIEDAEIARALSEALRSVRRLRGLSSKDVAARMDMKLRTYQYFEAGQGRLNFQRLKSFALASGCDLNGLIYAVLVGDANLAARGADNQLVTIAFYSVKAMSMRLGDKVSALEARDVISALDEAFRRVEEQLRQRLGSKRADDQT